MILLISLFILFLFIAAAFAIIIHWVSSIDEAIDRLEQKINDHNDFLKELAFERCPSLKKVLSVLNPDEVVVITCKNLNSTVERGSVENLLKSSIYLDYTVIDLYQSTYFYLIEVSKSYEG